jgi:Tol biopolymer transport system component
MASNASSVPTAAFSVDGRYVVFASAATNLIAGPVTDTNGNVDVFLLDRKTGTTTLVSRASSSPTTAGNDLSTLPHISADGRFVAYNSNATDLVPGQVDTNGGPDVFLFDRLSGANTLVSRTSSSAVSTGSFPSSICGISADGAFVAFLGVSTNLVPGQIDTNDNQDLFVYDRLAGTTMLVSQSATSATTAANDASFDAVMSADGRWIAYPSEATNLVPGQVQSPDIPNVFLFDRVAGTTALVSHRASSALIAGGGFSYGPSISADGQYVAYSSYATDLVSGFVDADGGLPDVFLFDRMSGASTLISHAQGLPARTANAGSSFAMISADGTAVAYFGFATNLAPGQVDPNGGFDVFVWDRVGVETTLVSRAAASPSLTGNGESFNPSISGNGSRVAFISLSTDLVAGQSDANGMADVFVFDRARGTTMLVGRTPASGTTTGNGSSDGPIISPDGNLVAFNSAASDLVTTDTNGQKDAFLWAPISFAGNTSFFPLTPCRVFDTRNPAGPTGGPSLGAHGVRDFTLAGACGIPANATAVSVNVTIASPTAAGVLKVYPAGAASSTATTAAFRGAGQTRANNAILAITGAPAGGVTVENVAVGTTDVLLDVNGYFR